jgi:tRNA (Thr-GGU) A37 N-methylase
VTPAARLETPVLDLRTYEFVAGGRVHAREDIAIPPQGVFNTRSSDRPDPSGLHEVQIISIDGRRVRVRNLEALDGTPIVDVKPVLNRTGAK